MASAQFVFYFCFYFCFVCFIWFLEFSFKFCFEGGGCKGKDGVGRVGDACWNIRKESVKVKYILKKNEISEENISVSTLVRKSFLISIMYLSIYVYIWHN